VDDAVGAASEEWGVRVVRFGGWVAAIVAVSVVAGCGGSGPAPAAPAAKIVPTDSGELSPEEAGGMRPEDSTAKELVRPVSPHGGTLVKLGTAGHLELVHDPSSGLLTAYVLDAAGAAVMRIPAKTITLEVTPAGAAAAPLVLNSTANGLTGDTVGNSSQFGGTLPALKGVTAFVGVVKEATVGGQTFKDIKFGYPNNG
jgi:predicted small lipoprotein YifL